MTEQRLAVLLDDLGLADCLVSPDPSEVDCTRAVDSFASPASLLRHQVGHRLWERLVGQSDYVAAFYVAFGGAPIGTHETLPSIADAQTHTTSAALEQWAEAFDAYMLILDIAGSAAERGLLVLSGPYDPTALTFAAIFDHALPYMGSIPTSAGDGGARKGARVTASKLTFVHSRVSAHCERARFYSLD